MFVIDLSSAGTNFFVASSTMILNNWHLEIHLEHHHRIRRTPTGLGNLLRRVGRRPYAICRIRILAATRSILPIFL